MEDPRDSPEPAPEVGPEAPGSRWVTMPEVGRLLGMSERGAGLGEAARDPHPRRPPGAGL